MGMPHLSSALSRTCKSPTGLSCFGLAAQFCWWQWFMGALEQVAPSFMSWCPKPLTGMQGTAILIISVILALRGPALLKGRRIDAVAVGALTVATLLIALGVANDRALPFVLAALALGGFGIAWGYTRWCTVYCRMKGDDVFVSAFGAFILAAPAKIILASLSPMAAAVVASLLPILAFQCVWRMEKGALETEPPPHAQAPARTMCIAKILLCVVSFSLIEAVVPTLLGVRVSDFSDNRFVLSQLVAAGLACAILIWLYTAHGEANFGWVWRCILLWMGVLLFLLTFGNQPSLYSTILYGSFSTIWLFLWIILIDVSRYAPLESVAFVGLGSALSWIPYSLCSIIVQELPDGSLPPEVSFFIFLALVAIMIVCTDTRDPDIRLVLSSNGISSWYPEDWHSIDNRCEQIAAERGLTKRETEVMAYVAKGRSRTYIAETLFVSENTVKAHTKHLYAKLGVRNRQELQDFLGMR